MNQYDRDMYFIFMVMYNRMTALVKDEESEICNADKHKIATSANMLKELFVQFRKREGQVAFDTLCKESEQYELVMHAKDEKIVETINSFEAQLVKPALEKIIAECSYCNNCNKKHYERCPWYTVKKFVGTTEKYKKNTCPYACDINDIFNCEL